MDPREASSRSIFPFSPSPFNIKLDQTDGIRLYRITFLYDPAFVLFCPLPRDGFRFVVSFPQAMMQLKPNKKNIFLNEQIYILRNKYTTQNRCMVYYYLYK